MFIKRYGMGPEVCFGIHGWSGDHRTFEPLARCLPSHISLYAVDLPGCGASEPPSEWTLHSVAEELANAIEQLSKPAPVTIVGNCSGALLGLQATALTPNAVERLVLIDPLAWWPWYFRVFAVPGFGKYAYATAFANPVGRWIANTGLRSKRRNDTDLTEGFATVRHDVNLHYLRILREIPTPESFAGITAPINIAFGSHTFGAVRESAKCWKTIWPQAELHELDGAGHLPLREAPEAISKIIVEGGACRRHSQRMSAQTTR